MYYFTAEKHMYCVRIFSHKAWDQTKNLQRSFTSIACSILLLIKILIIIISHLGNIIFDNKILTKIAGNVRIADISRSAHTNHRPLRQRVLHCTVRIDAARVQSCTRVAAHFLQTGHAAWTIAVNATFRLRIWY